MYTSCWVGGHVSEQSIRALDFATELGTQECRKIRCWKSVSFVSVAKPLGNDYSVEANVRGQRKMDQFMKKSSTSKTISFLEKT